METIITKPNEVSVDLMRQILDLLDQGSQISMKGIEKRLMNADLLAMMVVSGTVVTVAALKNPEPNYKKRFSEVPRKVKCHLSLKKNWATLLRIRNLKVANSAKND